jgi:hypothetical protein
MDSSLNVCFSHDRYFLTKLFFSATGLVIIKMFFVGTAAIVANLLVPASAEHLLLARILAVALFVGAPSGVFVDQDSFDEPHDVSFSDWSQ